MKVLNPNHLWLLCCLLIPIVIHFFIRSKVKILPFSSLFYFKDTLKKRSDKIRFSQKLLLLVRMLMVFCVCVCAAGVFIENVPWYFSNTGRVKKIVYVLDGSASLYRLKNGHSILSHLKNRFKNDLENQKPEDEVTVFMAGEVPMRITPFFVKRRSLDLDEVFQRWEVNQKNNDFNQSISEILSMASDQWKHQIIEIVGVTDFEGYEICKHNFKGHQEERMIRYVLPAEEMIFEGLNVYVESAHLVDVFWNYLHSRWQIRFNFKSCGQDEKTVQVQFNNGSDVIESRSVTLKNGAYTAYILVPIQRREIDPEFITVKVNGDDVRFDDEYFFKLPLYEELHFHLVGQDSESLRYLRNAMISLRQASEIGAEKIFFNEHVNLELATYKSEATHVVVMNEFLRHFGNLDKNNMTSLPLKRGVIGLLNGGNELDTHVFAWGNYQFRLLPFMDGKLSELKIMGGEPTGPLGTLKSGNKIKFIPQWKMDSKDPNLTAILSGEEDHSVFLWKAGLSQDPLFLVNSKMTPVHFSGVSNETMVHLLHMMIEQILADVWNPLQYETGRFETFISGKSIKDGSGRVAEPEYSSIYSKNGWHFNQPGVFLSQESNLKKYGSVNFHWRESHFMTVEEINRDVDNSTQKYMAEGNLKGNLDIGVVLLYILLACLLLETYLLKVLRP